jgi:glycosyltransferase involved in cell wall biosynthesis
MIPVMRQRPAPVIDVVVPVHNEDRVLETSISRLHGHLERHLTEPWRVVIADNASTDGTWDCARALGARLSGVQALHLEEKGRGRALRAAWLASDAQVLSYMDVDLSTDLAAFPRLVRPILDGRADMAIGSRLARGARVQRQLKREVLSRGYNLLVRGVFRTRISDAQCGFKAISAAAARRLLPHVVDQGWFFDTEMLLLAEHNGYRVTEVPVNWVEDTDSRVDIVPTVLADLRGLQRVRRSFGAGGGRVTVDLHRPCTAVPGLAGEQSPAPVHATAGRR